MKPPSSPRRPKTRDQNPPDANLSHIVKGIVRRGLNVGGPKELVSLRIDADVLNWFKASGAGYQTRINAVLRAYKDAADG